MLCKSCCVQHNMCKKLAPQEGFDCYTKTDTRSTAPWCAKVAPATYTPGCTHEKTFVCPRGMMTNVT